MNHHCHAKGCVKRVPPEMLMCKTHWFALPKKIRDAVWKHYRPGQCDDKEFTPEWNNAADAAIAFIALKEGKPVRPSEAEALGSFNCTTS